MLHRRLLLNRAKTNDAFGATAIDGAERPHHPRQCRYECSGSSWRPDRLTAMVLVVQPCTEAFEVPESGAGGRHGLP